MPHVIYCDRCNQNLVSKVGDLCENCKKAVAKQNRTEQVYVRLTTKPRSPKDIQGDVK